MQTHPLMAHAEIGEDEFVEIDGRLLHYVEDGKGAPILLIPDSFSTYRTWSIVFPILARSYRVIALDPLGAGDSDKPGFGFRYTAGEQADLIARLIRTLRLGKTHLVGTAFGGTIAFHLAARHPAQAATVTGIEGALLNPGAPPGMPLEALLRYPGLGDLAVEIIRSGWMDEGVLQALAGSWYPTMTKAELRRLLEEISFSTRSAAREAWYWTGIANRAPAPSEEEAGRITAPILYLAGDRSDFRWLTGRTIQFLYDRLPQAKVEIFKHGVHQLQSQKPHDVAQAIMEFIL